MIARFASVRLVKRRPGFVALIAATTILGLGAGIAMARLYDRVLLRALPFTDASELVSIDGASVMIAYSRPVTILPAYHVREFAALGLYEPGAVNAGVGDGSVRVPAARVDEGFFDVLRVPLSAGRPLSNEDQGLRHAVVTTEWWESLGRGRRQMRNEWLALVLASASAGAALLLCAIGIYGLLAQFVVTRTRDIAVRLMLGASQRHAQTQVLLLSLRLAVVGIAAGVGMALALARLAQASLPTLIGPAPLVLVASALFVLAAAVVASMGPANRAAAIDPVRVLQP